MDLESATRLAPCTLGLGAARQLVATTRVAPAPARLAVLDTDGPFTGADTDRCAHHGGKEADVPRRACANDPILSRLGDAVRDAGFLMACGHLGRRPFR